MMKKSPLMIYILILFMVISLPFAFAIPRDMTQPIFGLNWSYHSDMGRWQNIGNHSLCSNLQLQIAQAHIEATNIPSNITLVSLIVSPEILLSAIGDDNPIASTDFTLGYLANSTTLRMDVTKTRKGMLSWGTEETVKVYVDEPSTLGLNEILNYYFETSIGAKHFNGFRFNLWWKGGNEYVLQISVLTFRIELEASDITNPSMFKDIESKGALAGFFGPKKHEYQIYEKIITSSTNYVNCDAIQLYAYKSNVAIGASINVVVYEDNFVNGSFASYGYIGVSEGTTLVKDFFIIGGKAFSAIRLNVMGDLFYTIADYSEDFIGGFYGLIPIVLGLYMVFLIGMFFQTMIKGDWNILPNHFFSVFNFVFALFRTIVNMFWSLIGALSNVPLVGWLAIIGITTALIVFGIFI